MTKVSDDKTSLFPQIQSTISHKKQSIEPSIATEKEKKSSVENKKKKSTKSRKRQCGSVSLSKLKIQLQTVKPWEKSVKDKSPEQKKEANADMKEIN